MQVSIYFVKDCSVPIIIRKLTIDRDTTTRKIQGELRRFEAGQGKKLLPGSTTWRQVFFIRVFLC
jgi:hypothetical protein